MAKRIENVVKQEFKKNKILTGWFFFFFNFLAESAALMALDNPDGLGNKVSTCRRRKGLLMNTKIWKCMFAIPGASNNKYFSARKMPAK